MTSQTSLTSAVDALASQIVANTEQFHPIATIDHARLAKESGVEMPPCIVTIFSDAAANAPLIRANPLTGLDLPHRVLSYAEPNAAVIAYGDAEYLKRRHGIRQSDDLVGYGSVLDTAVAGIPTEIRRPVVSEQVTNNVGVSEIVSEHPFSETIERLRGIASGQDDTVWFGEVDFQAEAAMQGVAVPSNTLLLFGAPRPGGLCMAEFPRLGLDAFCQKLLVFEDESGSVRIAFNDIVAFANLHYGRSNQPQSVVDGRLSAAISAAASR